MNNEDTENTPYIFTFSFTVGGVVESDLPEEEVKEKIINDLSEVYGHEGFELKDFHPASQEELDAIHEVMGGDNEEAPTVN